MNVAPWLSLLLVSQSTLACRRDSPANPVPSVAVPVAPAPSQTAPAQSGDAAMPSAAQGGAPNRWLTPNDCTVYDKAPEYRDWTEPERANSRLNCTLVEELRAFVEARQSCASDADCQSVPGSCPFGCFIPAAAASAPAVEAKLAELQQRQEAGGARCMYRCMAPSPPVCTNGRCTETNP